MPDFADLFHSLTPEQQEQALNGPTLPPPEGITPNFDNPPNRNGLAMGVMAAFFAASTIIVLLWLISKLFCQRKFHVGDGFIIAGYGLLVGYFYCVWYWIDLTGMYVHTWDIRLRVFSDWLYNVYVGVNIYGGVIISMKIGILLEWARLFTPRGVRNAFWWTCQITLAINILFYGSAKLVDNLACWPHNKIWDQTVQGHCLDTKASTFGSSIINLVSDIVILILPHSVIWRLKMSRAKKFGLASIFAAGILGCVAAAFRVVTCAHYYLSTDAAYDLSPVVLWDMVEMSILFVIACMPSIPAIFREPRVRTFLSDVGLWTAGTRNSRATYPGWHPHEGGTVDTARHRAYRHIKDNSLSALGAGGGGGGRSPDTSQQSMIRVQVPSPSLSPASTGIMRTTDFTAQIDYADAEAQRLDYYQRVQHPWTIEKS
ncbi:hypothetical protein F4780DRAFT_617541 [Xylariomycetidae sp. FL0641]|nr:hypothetical protein F4780DRAFT_617541 [Xylariomycetidae sp. FL0641]